MQAKSLRQTNSETHEAPCYTGIHVVGNDISEDEERLNVFQCSIGEKVREAEAFETATDVDL